MANKNDNNKMAPEDQQVTELGLITTKLILIVGVNKANYLCNIIHPVHAGICPVITHDINLS